MVTERGKKGRGGGQGNRRKGEERERQRLPLHENVPQREGEIKWRWEPCLPRQKRGD